MIAIAWIGRRAAMNDLAASQHQNALVINLSALVARMARRLRKHKEHVEDHNLAEAAENYLRANGLLGSILREVSANGEDATQPEDNDYHQYIWYQKDE